MSPGYPARTAALNSSNIYHMFFGGEPTDTYTTMTLHSGIKHLRGASLEMTNGKAYKHLDPRMNMSFSETYHERVSVHTMANEVIYMYDTRDSTTQTHAAFLFSFKGRYTL